jgi:hypothetical protein
MPTHTSRTIPEARTPRRVRARSALGAALAIAAIAVPATMAAGTFVEDVEVIQTFQGSPTSGYYGWAVSELADIDGDGATDTIIGDPTNSAGGTVDVFSSATGSHLYGWQGAPGSLLGYAIADAGDTNADGVHDILAGDIRGAGMGIADLRSGADGSLLHRFSGSAAGDQLGAAVAGAGDVDGDGFADVLIGARNVDTAVGVDAGVAYVFSGADYHLIRTYRGPDVGGLFGTGTDVTGDLDSDGVLDHVIGARDSGAHNHGQVFVYSGASGRLLWSVAAPRSGGDFGSFFVAGLDDLDGDGTPDVYAADYADKANGGQSGRASVLSGANGSLIYTWTGSRPKEGTGPGREAGDIDGDGTQDVAVGSYLSSRGARLAGRVDVFSGADGTLIGSVTSRTLGENLGFDTVGLGDVDGDGRDDLMVSAATGRSVYIISGASIAP